MSGWNGVEEGPTKFFVLLSFFLYAEKTLDNEYDYFFI